MCSEALAQAEQEALLFLGISSSLSSFQLTSFLSLTLAICALTGG